MQACWFKLSLFFILLAGVQGHAQTHTTENGNKRNRDDQSTIRNSTAGANTTGSATLITIKKIPTTPKPPHPLLRAKAVKQQLHAKPMPINNTDTSDAKEKESEKDGEGGVSSSSLDTSKKNIGSDVTTQQSYWRIHHKKKHHRKSQQIASADIAPGNADTIHQNTVSTTAAKSGDSIVLIVLGNLILFSLIVYAYWPKKK